MAEEEEEFVNIEKVNAVAVPIIGKDDRLIDKNMEYFSLPLNKFAIKILKDLPEGDKNHVVCTANLFACFSANGNSKEQLYKFLQLNHWSPPFSDKSIFKTIQSVLQVATSENSKLRPSYDWFNVFRILIDKKAYYSNEFKNDTKRYFNVDIDKIDFERDSGLIVNQMTELMQMEIDPDIHPFNTRVDRRTQMVILTAVHFKCKWDIQFPSNDIKDEYFYGENRTTVKMMAILHNSFNFLYVPEWDVDIVEMPLTSHSMTFVLLLPKTFVGFDRLWDELNETKDCNHWNTVMKGLHLTRCDIFLPKFRIECDYDFAKLYSRLTVFKTSPQEAVGARTYPVKPNNILHKVVFEVNENGLNPAEPDLTNPGLPRLVRADHPFIFLVRDMRTWVYVFVGKVNSIQK